MLACSLAWALRCAVPAPPAPGAPALLLSACRRRSSAPQPAAVASSPAGPAASPCRRPRLHAQAQLSLPCRLRWVSSVPAAAGAPASSWACRSVPQPPPRPYPQRLQPGPPPAALAPVVSSCRRTTGSPLDAQRRLRGCLHLPGLRLDRLSSAAAAAAPPGCCASAAAHPLPPPPGVATSSCMRRCSLGLAGPPAPSPGHGLPASCRCFQCSLHLSQPLPAPPPPLLLGQPCGRGRERERTETAGERKRGCSWDAIQCHHSLGECRLGGHRS